MTKAELRVAIDTLEGIQSAIRSEAAMGMVAGGGTWAAVIELRLNRLRAQLAALPPEPEPWTPRDRRLREALDTVKTKWKAWPPLTESTAHAMHLGEIVVAVDAALAAIRAARGTK